MESALKMFAFITKLNRFTNYGFAVNSEFKFTHFPLKIQQLYFVIHFPVDYSAETFISLARPLSENYLEKLDFYGTRNEKWRPKLLQKIPGSQLPPKYGGDKDWKPLPLTSPRVKACERWISHLSGLCTGLKLRNFKPGDLNLFNSINFTHHPPPRILTPINWNSYVDVIIHILFQFFRDLQLVPTEQRQCASESHQYSLRKLSILAHYSGTFQPIWV